MTQALSKRTVDCWNEGMKMPMPVARSRHRHPRPDALEYRLYTVLLFPLAVLAVFASRLTGRGSATDRHFLREVTEFNRATVPWIFMGR